MARRRREGVDLPRPAGSRSVAAMTTSDEWRRSRRIGVRRSFPSFPRRRESRSSKRERGSDPFADRKAAEQIRLWRTACGSVTRLSASRRWKATREPPRTDHEGNASASEASKRFRSAKGSDPRSPRISRSRTSRNGGLTLILESAFAERRAKRKGPGRPGLKAFQGEKGLTCTDPRTARCSRTERSDPWPCANRRRSRPRSSTSGHSCPAA
jgi:hypothetical protein